MPDDARPFQFRRRIHDTADGPFRCEYGTDRAAGVHTLDALAVVGSAVMVEVPPRDAVLGGDDSGGLVEQRLDERPARRVRVGLEPEEDIVDGADVGGVVGGVGVRGEVTAGAENPYAVLPHGREVRSTGDKMDVGACLVQGGADIGTDGSGAEDGDFHWVALRSVEGVPRNCRKLSTKYCLQDGSGGSKGPGRRPDGRLGPRELGFRSFVRRRL